MCINFGRNIFLVPRSWSSVKVKYQGHRFQVKTLKVFFVNTFLLGQGIEFSLEYAGSFVLGFGHFVFGLLKATF